MNCSTPVKINADDSRRRFDPDGSAPIILTPPGGWGRGAAQLREHAAEATLAARTSLLVCPSGVLYDDTLWWRWLLQLLARMGLCTHREAFWELWRRDYYDAVCQGERTYWDALQHFLLAAGLSRGQIDEVCAAGRPRWRLFDEQLRPFPHVPAALAALQQAGCAISVLAHSPQPGGELAQRYQQMGIGGCLQSVVTSRDLGCGPADPNFVRGALARLCWTTAETILVTHETLRAGEQPAELAVARIAVDRANIEPAQWDFECLDELAALLLSPAEQRVA